MVRKLTSGSFQNVSHSDCTDGFEGLYCLRCIVPCGIIEELVKSTVVNLIFSGYDQVDNFFRIHLT